MKRNNSTLWVEFDGYIIRETSTHYDLCASNGSNGQIRIEKSDLVETNGEIKLRIGAKIEILHNINTHKSKLKEKIS